MSFDKLQQQKHQDPAFFRDMVGEVKKADRQKYQKVMIIYNFFGEGSVAG